MKIFYAKICFILLTAAVCFAQGGLYSTVDPEGKSANTFKKCSLNRVVGDTIKEIIVTEYIGGWENRSDAKRELIALFEDKEIIVSSEPLWNMDIPVELIGIIVFNDGSTGKFAVAQHRVGFQDSTGRPWYFQWQERSPREE